MVVGHCCWCLSGPLGVRVVVVVVVVSRVVGCSLVGDSRTGTRGAGVGVGVGMVGVGIGSLPPSVGGSSVPCLSL